MEKNRTRTLFLIKDIEAVVSAAASHAKRIKVNAQASRFITRALNASIRKHPNLLCPEPEAFRTVREMWRMLDEVRRLAGSLGFSKKPILSSRHGSEDEIMRRATRRAEFHRRALALTAGSGSLDAGYARLQHVAETLKTLEGWLSATAHEYSQTPEFMRTQFPDQRRQGDHRSVHRLAIEAFVFDALHVFGQIIGQPGTAKVGGTSDRADTPDSPAIRYLDEIFRVLRKKVAGRSDLAVEVRNALRLTRGQLAYLIRKHNENKKPPAAKDA